MPAKSVSGKVPSSITNAKSAKVSTSRRRKRNDKLDTDNWLNGLVYAPFGTGKTYLAGTSTHVDEMKPALYANLDYGDKGLPKDFEGDIYDVTNYQQFSNFYDFCRQYAVAREKGDDNKMMELEARLFNEPVESIKEPKRYRTIIVDDLADVQRLNKYLIQGINPDNLMVQPKKFDWDDWQATLDMISIMLSAFRSLPMHTIFVCTTQEETDNKKQIHYVPALQGQSKREVLGYFDFVGFYQMITPDVKMQNGDLVANGQIVRRLFLAPVGPFKAKNRFEKLDEYWIDDPTMQDIYDLL